ncbi:MAG: hypothetical protein ABSF95_05695 [Verrucomicrobiota bacterium]
MQDSGPRRSSAARIEIAPPRRFGAWAEVAVHAYGLVLVLPILVSVLVMSLRRFELWSLLLPLAAMGGTAYFLPFGLGNAYLTKLVRVRHAAAGKEADGFIVQLTLSPRIRSGFWAVVEDADDIGYLRLTAAELVFEGDAVKVCLPYSQIGRVRSQNIGLRGLFVYGRRIAVEVTGLPNVAALEFAERSSWLLPASLRTTQKLRERLSAKAATQPV